MKVETRQLTNAKRKPKSYSQVEIRGEISRTVVKAGRSLSDKMRLRRVETIIPKLKKE